MHIKQVVGQGAESVYVFHYPSQFSTEDNFPCKIGRTGRDSVAKRLAQYQAGMQEEPVVDLVMRCDDSTYLEHMLHQRLATTKMDTHGSEWYKTTPDGVLTAYYDLLDPASLPLHDQIRRARSLALMTQGDLAEAAGVSISKLSALEQGFDINVSCLVDVATALGLDVTLSGR